MVANIVHKLEERLIKHKIRLRTIVYYENRISQIEKELSGPAGMKYSDMPKSQKPTDKVSLLIQEKIDKEKLVNNEMKILNKEGLALRHIVGKMYFVPSQKRGPLFEKYIDLIRYYYFEDKNWEDMMNIFADDFKKRDESDLRKIHKWHHKALVQLAKSQKENS